MSRFALIIACVLALIFSQPTPTMAQEPWQPVASLEGEDAIDYR